MNRRRWELGVSILAMCASAACTASTGTGQGAAPTGAPTGSASVTGTFDGQSFQPVDAFAVVSSDPAGTGLLVFISSAPNACLHSQEDVGEPNSASLMISLDYMTDPKSCPTPPIATGTYNLTPPPGTPIGSCGATLSAIANFDQSDQACNVTKSARPLGGTVVLSSITSSLVEGSFDFLLDGGQEVKGQFSAPMCDQSMVRSGAPSCGS